MKNFFNKLLSILLVMVSLTNMFPATGYAAHKHKGVMCGKQVTYYENITSTKHTRVVANEEKCSCGEVIGYIDHRKTTENHSFKDDKCTACGYKREHTHKGVMCGKAIKKYIDINSKTHTLYTANENLCSCGKMLGYIDENTKKENHTFKDDKCTKCGYKREHVHKGVMCGKAISRYENITASEHTLYTANENLCSCGKILGYIDEKRTTNKHIFFNDVCSDCGYKREHVHKGVMCGKAISHYENITATEHTLYTANENLCECGAMLGYIDEKRTTNKHIFFNDVCSDCGYKREHVHKGVMCGKAISRYEDITATHHTLYTANENLCECGAMLGYIDEKRTMNKHIFFNDVCSDCGYKREHVHKGVMCGKAISRYEDITATHHTLYTANENLCECGAMLGYIDEKRTTNKHIFFNDVCSDCGYKREHTHKGVMCGKAISRYEDITATHHTLYTANENLCECGAMLGYIDEKRTTNKHIFFNDVCSDCGYKREHVHKGVMCGKKITKYIDLNRLNHTYYVAYENLCSCGKVVGYIDESYNVHDHTFVDDKCKYCGYQRKHEHKGVKCGKAINEYINVTATEHTRYTANESLCSCGTMLGYVDERRVTEKHTFVGDTCSGCGYNREHVHVVSETKNAKQTYEKNNYKTHKVTEYLGDNYCACGAYVSKGKTTTYEEEHLFMDKKCIFCGQKDDHVHKGVSSAKPETYYTYSNEKQHVKTTVSGGSYCSCGEFIPEENGATRVVFENHTFKDKKCKYCGYSTKGYLETAVEQAVKGDFSDDSNAAGITGQILIGEIPIIGTIADIRDLIASDSPESFLLNLAAFIPGVGALKYSDEIAVVLKHSDDGKVVIKNASKVSDVNKLLDAAKVNVRHGDEVAETMREVARASDTPMDSYKNFDKFKQQYGKAGEGQEWHHLVEQSQIKKSGFDSEMVNNGNNMIPLDKETHHKVSGYYSRKVPGTDMSFRDWMAYKGFTFEEQQEIGIYVLEMYGVKVK